MHQLTKDPSADRDRRRQAASSPRACSRRFELTRYLDYCSEMVSLTSKVAVLFAQGFPDPTVTDVVSDIERVAVGLSQKIWQKIIILETRLRGRPRHATHPRQTPPTRPPSPARSRQRPLGRTGEHHLSDPVQLAQALIRCRSVTPTEGGALTLLESVLRPAGFTCHRLTMTEPGTPDVENLYARFGAGANGRTCASRAIRTWCRWARRRAGRIPPSAPRSPTASSTGVARPT